MHISTSFSESQRELQGSYHYATYFSAFAFYAAESGQASEASCSYRLLNVKKFNREIQRLQPKKPCKITSISFSLRTPLMVAAVFPKLSSSRRKAGGHYLAQAPLLSIVALPQ